MKILKRTLLVLAILVAIPLLLALFIKREYTIEKEIVIDKPRQEVYNYVKLLKSQEQYNKWVMADPAMKKDLRGTDGTVGFVYAWDGNDQAGAGEQEIKTLVEGQSIFTELRFKRPFESVATTSMSLDSLDANKTKAKWSMSGNSPYPFNLMNLCMNKMLGGDMTESQTLLKTYLEKQ